jgi:hypothetical protein
MKHLLNFVRAGRFREIYNMFWVYPLWWNRRLSHRILNKILPAFGIDLFPPFLEIEPTTICNFRCVCCVPKDSSILCSEPKLIQELQVGEQVFNKNGKEQKILETFERRYVGNLIEIKAEGIFPFCFWFFFPVSF